MSGPVTHKENLDKFLDFWLQPCLFLSVAVILEVDQGLEALSVSLSLPLSSVVMWREWIENWSSISGIRKLEKGWGHSLSYNRYFLSISCFIRSL